MHDLARPALVRTAVGILTMLATVLAALAPSAASAADPVIAAAGDISCSSLTVQSDRCHMKATSDLLVNAGLSGVLTLGDEQYQNGEYTNFVNYYDQSWGRVKSITYPAPGNHEYQTSGASGYYDYYNGVGNQTGRAGDRSKGYYSFDIGTWHLIALNSNDACTIVSCAAGSAQETWLKADLAAHTNYCTLAYWHHPSFNSGNGGNLSAMQPELTDLYDANADVILGGHAHDYERFAPQNPSGGLDNARGIRQFVVGTGGAFWTAFGTIKANSQVRQNSTYGVLKMTLHPTGYDWQFVSEAGGTFTDSGTGSCHGGTPDTTKPSAPGSLTATPGTGQVSLSWQASTDNVGVTGYNIFRGGTQVATVGGTTTSYTDTGLAPGTYTYTVQAADGAGNVSNASNTATATVADTTKPSTPGLLTATAGTAQVGLSWQPSTDDVGVTAYLVFRGPTQIGSVNGSTTTYTDTGLAPGTYTYTVVAKDAAGNASSPSNAASATVGDTTKPSTPTGLTATGGTAKVDLSWQASTDNVGVTAYLVFRGSTQIGSVNGTTTTYTDSGLAAGSYTYTVVAKDAAGNVSGASNAATGTVPDTTKPSVPGTLTATGSAGQVALSWQASTDDVGVTSYLIFKGSNQIGSVNGTTTSYTDSGLAAGSYTYTVVAKDAAGNVSGPSNAATGTVPDTTKPSAPGSLTATGGTAKVDLSWQASTDDVGVTGYRIFRGTSQVGSVGGSTTTWSHTGLTPGSYTYTVVAVDAAGNISDPSNSATGTVPDTTKPSAPGNLTATGSAGQVALSWQASTDDVGVSGYQVYRGTSQIGTVGGTVTSYTDQGLSPGTYSYTVKAVDAAGNTSDPSTAATGTVPDTTKPTTPQNLTANANGLTQVDLSWQASTDDVAVTGYNVYRNGSLIASTGTTTSYSDTVLIPGKYAYVVKAFDAAGNLSDASNGASVDMLSPDNQKPTAPGNLLATLNGSQVDLTWDASTDDTGVTSYNIYRDGTLLESISPATSYSDAAVPAGDHTYVVRALDAAGNISDPSNSAPVTVPDTQKPTAPQSLQANAVSSSEVDLSWQASTDDVGVTGYDIYRDGALLESIAPATTYSDTTVTPGPYSYQVYAHDAAGNVSDASNSVPVTVNPPDTEKPTAPGNLTATANGASKIDLAWLASTDNVGVTAYDIYRNDTYLTSIDPATSYSDTGVVPGVTYTYYVVARDAAANASDPSTTASAMVDPLDTEKPSAPQSLTATLNGTNKVDLSWQASSDNVGVTGYNVYRDGTLIKTTSATTTYTDGPLAVGSYQYEVRALDAAGNLSDPSNTATGTVPDSQKPTAPGTLTATPNGAGRIDLGWQASSDNVGVTGYQIYRGTSQIGAVGGTVTSYSDSGLSPGSYTYTVKAVDAAGNVSDPSNSAGATLSDTQKPTTPQNLTATPSAPKVNLSWQASTDDVGVTGYRVFRGTTQIATVSGTSTTYQDTPPDGATYTYTVKAVDAAGNLSDPSNSATATLPDVTRPTPPANLTANVAGARVDLSWQASTDNVGVTRYRVYRGSIRIATVDASVLSYSDTGLAAGTYKYKIQAMDAAGNLSGASNTVTVTISDTTKPSAPQNLTATLNGTNVSLTWQASTDNVGVTGYQVFRGTTQIATLNPTTTSYIDSPPGAGAYQYTVKAVDAGGNVSDPSNTASATVPDTQKPSAPQSLTAAPNGSSQIDLAWQASTDNVGVTGYRVFRGTTQIASLGGTATSYSDTGLSSGSYDYTVKAVDAAGNLSDASNTASATLSAPATLTLSPDADAQVNQGSPTTNFGSAATIGTDFSTGTSNIESFLRFTVSGVTPGAVRSVKLRLHSTSDGTADGPAVYTTGNSWSETTINWNNKPAPTSAATDDKGAIAANSWVEYDVTPFVTANGTYSFRLATSSTDGVYFSSREAASFQPELVISTGAPDTTKPTAPGSLAANAAGPNEIDLSWLTSTDNIGVTGYNVYRGGTLLAGIGSVTSYADTSVVAGTSYSYDVRALDAAGNLSDPSNTATADTPAGPTVLTFSPDADARVQQSAPTTNYGTATTIGTDFSSSAANIESFLRFTVTGVSPGSVASAKLRLTSTSDGTADGPAVYTTGTTWNETTVNWNTKPAPTSAATDDKGAIAANTTVDYDVTPFVTGNGTYSFRLATTSTDGVYFNSREAATARPQLVVTTH